MNSYDNVLVDDGSGHAGGGWFSAEIDYGSGQETFVDVKCLVDLLQLYSISLLCKVSLICNL